jgi:hypothetical protein
MASEVGVRSTSPSKIAAIVVVIEQFLQYAPSIPAGLRTGERSATAGRFPRDVSGVLQWRPSLTLRHPEPASPTGSPMTFVTNLATTLRTALPAIPDDARAALAVEIAAHPQLGQLPDHVLAEVIRQGPLMIMHASEQAQIVCSWQAVVNIFVTLVADDVRSTIDPVYRTSAYCPYPGLLAFTPEWKELGERGYTGKRGTVLTFVTRLRRAPGIPTGKRTIRDGTVALPERRPLTPRMAVWQVLQRPETQDAMTEACIRQLRHAHPELDEAITLTEGVATLIRARDPASLDRWLAQAATSTLKPFQRFAASLRRDDNAVRAGVAQKWSTGLVEGEINKLKMVKRAMFARASFPLLQRRILVSG